MGVFRNILKHWFLIWKVRNRFAPATQILQRNLFHYYRDCLRLGNLPNLSETGFRVFSQGEEDGKLLFIFAIIGMENKQFVDIGSNDGVNSNCANLFFNFAWRGLFLDSDSWNIKRGQHFYRRYPTTWNYQPTFLCAKASPENINSLLEQSGFRGEIGFLSIDIDGNDYWIWDAIHVIEPKVVMIETHLEFGLQNIVVPYHSKPDPTKNHPAYHGASPVAMVNLAKRKGYRLVGANELGFNFIFIKNGIADDLIPEVSVESVLTHPSALEGRKAFEAIKDWEYVRG